jgi:hypothetical protein
MALFGNADGHGFVFVGIETADDGGGGGQRNFVFAAAAAKEDTDAQSLFVRGHGNRWYGLGRLFLVIGERLRVVAGEVGTRFWSDNGDLAAFFCGTDGSPTGHEFDGWRWNFWGFSSSSTAAEISRRICVCTIIYTIVFASGEWWRTAP